jgi:hypothetical protein
MEGFAAARVAALPLDEVGEVLPMSADRWLVHRRSMTRELAVVELLVVDAQLAPIWRLPVPDPYRGVHAVSSDLSLVGLSLQHRVLLLDGRGQQLASFPHQPWGMGDPDSGCCAFSSCGRYLWATVPTWPQGSWQANDELWLIDLASAAICWWASARPTMRVLCHGAVSSGVRVSETTTLSISLSNREISRWVSVKLGSSATDGQNPLNPS